jgi:hypothetical protein
LERIGKLAKDGKSLEQIKSVEDPRNEDWAGQDRFGNNVEAAYRGVVGVTPERAL